MKTTSYHTCLKELVRHGLLPRAYATKIHRTTIWRWKNEPAEKYLGGELYDLELLGAFIQRKESTAIMRSYLKMALTLKLIVGKCSEFKRKLEQNKAAVVKSLMKLNGTIRLNVVLKVLDISVSTFHHWKNQVLYPCKASPFQLCKRIYPNQLTAKEVHVMRTLLTKDRFKYWPVCSIAMYALRKKILTVSTATWYHYIKKLGLKRPSLPGKKKHGLGIRAEAPDQIWHADITIVHTLDGKRNFLYLVMDNYSRKILSWTVASRIAARVRLDTIQQAYYATIQNKPKNIRLIVDGGPENNNQLIDHYLAEASVSITKQIAQADIVFSNSMVEAQNKLLKYRYLFTREYLNTESLKKELPWIIDDYNNKRPHIALAGLTPSEAYTGEKISKKALAAQFDQARKSRYQENTANPCEICE